MYINSGGQQRRASFIVALLHEPSILILDEPTVGVDPVLRSRYLNHRYEFRNAPFYKLCLCPKAHTIGPSGPILRNIFPEISLHFAKYLDFLS